jgi:hypothetical protein
MIQNHYITRDVKVGDGGVIDFHDYKTTFQISDSDSKKFTIRDCSSDAVIGYIYKKQVKGEQKLRIWMMSSNDDFDVNWTDEDLKNEPPDDDYVDNNYSDPDPDKQDV